MKFLWLTFIFIIAGLLNIHALPVINEVHLLTGSVEMYGKFEAELDLSATFDNPYDYDQLSISAVFNAPSGNSKEVDGFYMQDYTLNTSSGTLTPAGSGTFRIRFSPDETGIWSFTISATDSTGTALSNSYTFQCTDITTSKNRGFIRSGNTNYLQFDNGTQYIPVGENIAWQNNNAYLDYRNWLTGLIENHGNFFRLWHAHWGLGIEWKNGWSGFQGLRKYKQSNCFYQDWLFDYCAENGIYVMLTLQHHGTVSTQVNPNWNDSPYNAANGGSCLNTIDFFTNDDARAHTKNRYRYILARWGYSRAILCWELFNEVLWTDNFQQNKTLVAEWHFEMAEYLKSIDPNNHLVTTSYGGDNDDPNVWNYPDIEITQTHIYINTPNIERALAHVTRKHLATFGKPSLNGEFGLGIHGGLASTDPDGIHIHNSLWGGLFGGGLGTAMTWWWDNYMHPYDLYYHFSGISVIADQIPFVESNLRPVRSYVTGAPGDLNITPTLGWGVKGDDEITIDIYGNITPEDASLAQFLYGSQWNTQFRSPPTFHVDYSAPGAFTVHTGPEIGTDPNIAIWMDGILQLEEAATPNTSYTIQVPANTHSLKVDNTGTDWTTISSYSFEGQGSQVDAYVLISEDESQIAGWVLNNLYNHDYVINNGMPPTTPESQVLVEGFVDGTYTVRYSDPLTGTFTGDTVATSSNGILTVPIPSLVWDLAFTVDQETASIHETTKMLDFKVFPNPVRAGSEINISISEADQPIDRLTLLDMAGREIIQLNSDIQQLSIPGGIPFGMYWIKIESKHKIGTHGLVITN